MSETIILLETNTDEPTEVEFNGETITNFGHVVISVPVESVS